MNHLETYLAFRKKRKQAYQYAMWLISFQETEAPKNAIDYRSQQIEVLSTLAYEA